MKKYLIAIAVLAGLLSTSQALAQVSSPNFWKPSGTTITPINPYSVVLGNATATNLTITGTCTGCGGAGGGSTTINSLLGPNFTIAGGSNVTVATSSPNTITISSTASGSAGSILPLIANGSVAGVNASSSTVSFNIQGSGALIPLNVSSSSATSLLRVNANGNVGIGTTSNAGILTIDGTASDGNYAQVAITDKAVNGVVTADSADSFNGQTGIFDMGSLSASPLVLSYDNYAACGLYSDNTLDTLFDCYSPPNGDEMTFTNSLAQTGYTVFHDNYLMNYGASTGLQAGNIYARTTTTGTLPSLLSGFWTDTAGHPEATNTAWYEDIEPSGQHAIGDLSSTTTVLKTGPIIQLGASSTAASELAVYGSATPSLTNSLLNVNQNGNVGIGSDTPTAALTVVSSVNPLVNLYNGSNPELTLNNAGSLTIYGPFQAYVNGASGPYFQAGYDGVSGVNFDAYNQSTGFVPIKIDGSVMAFGTRSSSPAEYTDIGTTTGTSSLNIVSNGQSGLVNISSTSGASLLSVSNTGNVNVATLTASSLVGTDANKNLVGETLLAGTNVTITTSTPGQITIAASGTGGGGGVSTTSPFSSGFDSYATGSTPSLTNGVIMDNGIVAGIGATSSTVSFNLQGTGTLNLLNIASSSTKSILQVLSSNGVQLSMNASSTNSSTTVASTVPVLQLGSTALSSPSANGTFLGANSLSGFTGNFLQFQNNGTSEMSLSSAGILTLPSTNAGALTIGAGTSGGVQAGQIGTNGGSTTFTVAGNILGGNAGYLMLLNDNGNSSRSYTSGAGGMFQIKDATTNFNPTSGSGTFAALEVDGNNINQTGSANGITRNLYVLPATITQAYDYRNLEVKAITENVDASITPATTAYNVLINPITYANSSTTAVTLNSASTLNITNPIASSSVTIASSAALTILGGSTQTGTGTTTNAYGAWINAPTGATNNYAAALMGNVGVGTSTPANPGVEVTNGDVYVASSTRGIILKDTVSGTCYRIQMTSGALTPTSLSSCP